MGNLNKIGLQVRAEFIKSYLEQGKKKELLKLMNDEKSLSFINAMCQSMAEWRTEIRRDLQKEVDEGLKELEEM